MNDSQQKFLKTRFKVDLDALPPSAQRVVQSFGERAPLSRDTNREFEIGLTFCRRPDFLGHAKFIAACAPRRCV